MGFHDHYPSAGLITPIAHRPAIENVGINLRSAHIVVPQKFLDCSYTVALLKEPGVRGLNSLGSLDEKETRRFFYMMYEQRSQLQQVMHL